MAGTTPVATTAPTAKFDTATLGAVLSKLDKSFTTEQFAALFKGAGNDETKAVKAVFQQLTKIVLGQSGDVGEADLPGLIKQLDTAIDGGASGKLLSLSGISSDKLVGLANSDIGVRYALINGLPFAITGNAALYDNLNRDGSLFRFDPNTGEKLYTDEWLKDRAQFSALKSNSDGSGSVSVNGSQSWTFEERTDSGASKIVATASDAQRAANKMIFATATTTTQTIVGGASTDHIYSGSGDDLINTGAGDDYVEGGAGDDLIDGGRGNDTLLGGQGDDQLDGNVGDDKLFGGAGADYLIGGKGNDRLDGGNGFDTYVIDSGDGADTIVDADGKGEIILDGQALTGPATFADGVYKSADGKLTYAFAGDPEEGGVLVINSEAGSLKLVNFKNGALGITLGDGSSSALLTGVDSRGTLDLWGGNRTIDLPNHSIDRVGPVPPVLPVGDANGSLPSGDGIVPPTALDSPVATVRSYVAGGSTSAKVALNGDFGDLFTDPTVNVPLLTGDHVNTAIELSSSQALKASPRTSALSVPFGITTTFLNPADLQNDFGINPRQIEYALLDFHNAVSIGSLLGSDSLGDASSIGIGTLSIGASFDSKQLSDDKYTDLGSKKIGVKG